MKDVNEELWKLGVSAKTQHNEVAPAPVSYTHLAGLRGYLVGEAQVSEKHCGFVINRGNATAADVRTLMQNVADIVEEKFGVRLEPEVKMIGEF